MQNRSTACLSLLAASALLLAAPRQAASEESGDASQAIVLRLRTVAGADGAASARRTFSTAHWNLQPGDTLEYDVFLHANQEGLGGIDGVTEDGVHVGFLDLGQEARGAQGQQPVDLRQQAYGQWCHRRLAVPADLAGKTVVRWDLVDAGVGRAPLEVAAAMYDHICITNNSRTVLTLDDSGAAELPPEDQGEPDRAWSVRLFRGPVHDPRPQSIVHFFVWHDFPDNISVYVPRFPFHPHGLLRDQPWPGYGAGFGQSPPAGYYSSRNTYWYEQELQDMKRAGFDTALICSWGECPVNPWFRTSLLEEYLVPALERSGVDVKIAMLDASYSQVAEWNYDQAGQYQPAYTAYVPEAPAALSNPDPDLRKACQWEDDRDPEAHVVHRSPSVRWDAAAKTGVPEPELVACRAAHGDTRRYRHRYVYDFAAVDLHDQRTWPYYYERKIRPFFRAIPPCHWATHNGHPIEQGGRPIIVTYYAGWCQRESVISDGRALWEWVKESFARDFRDARGQGIRPFIIHGHGWYGDQRPSGPLVDCGSDAVSFWGSALTGPSVTPVTTYRCFEIGPGFDSRLEAKANGAVGDVKDRLYGEQLVRWFDEPAAGCCPWECDAVIVETWNELWEGTAIQRAVDYPAPGGGYLPETYYMDTWRALVETTFGLREYDATFLQTWRIPEHLVRGSGALNVTVRNDGLLPWEQGNVKLAAWLEDPASGARLPGTLTQWEIPRTLLKGEDVAVAWEPPVDWPAGRYTLRFDLVQNASTWFTSLGDVAPRVEVDIE